MTQRIVNNWLDGFRQYFDFYGRSTRGEYWSWVLVNSLILLFSLVVMGLLSRVGPVGSVIALVVWIIYLVYLLVALIPGLSYTVRRLHDANFPGWLVILCFVTAAAGLIVLIVLTLRPSYPGTNQYGNPKQVGGQNVPYFIPETKNYPFPQTPGYGQPGAPGQGSYYPYQEYGQRAVNPGYTGYSQPNAGPAQPNVPAQPNLYGQSQTNWAGAYPQPSEPAQSYVPNQEDKTQSQQPAADPSDEADTTKG